MADEKKRSIWARIGGFFKDVVLWIPDHLGESIAVEIREDLGLKPGEKIPEDKKAKFQQFGAGIDPRMESYAELARAIADVAPEIQELAEALETDDLPAREISYLLLRLVATDIVRTRVPLLYALARLELFFEQDTESLVLLDPSRLLRNLRGEDLPSGEALAQSVSFWPVLVMQLLDGVVGDGEQDPESADPERPGHLDVFSGWDLAPESVTPNADLLALRATTLNVSSADGSGAHLLVSLLAVPPEHGGPGVFLSLGGALTLERVEHQTRYRLDAGFGGAFDMFIPFGDGAMDLAVNAAGDTIPFLKLAVGAGQADEPALRIGDPDSTRLDVYESELGIDVTEDDAALRAALRGPSSSSCPARTASCGR